MLKIFRKITKHQRYLTRIASGLGVKSTGWQRQLYLVSQAASIPYITKKTLFNSFNNINLYQNYLNEYVQAHNDLNEIVHNQYRLQLIGFPVSHILWSP